MGAKCFGIEEIPHFEGRASMLVSYVVAGSNFLAKVQTESVIHLLRIGWMRWMDHSVIRRALDGFSLGRKN